ncbi:hypothetical protein ACJIZ3_000675 [Penstemon smallii]|uniref:Actin cross-linking n=1 Tax=Penstemon smallii TaxID=265156 RepID=A0ABD3RCB7_9LAMI
MEFFNKAKAVRLKSHLNKYLTADDDQQTIRQSKNGSSKKARWVVEFVEGNPHAIRLKGCHGGYLTASEESSSSLLGMTGKKVVQTFPNNYTKKDGSIEWEPIKEGYNLKLRTKGGKFLRANGATPPWRNSITHDLPHRTATQDWVLWEVDVVDISVLDDAHLPPSNGTSFSSEQDDFIGSDSPTMNRAEIPEAKPIVSHRRETSMTENGRWLPSIATRIRRPSLGSDRSNHGSGKLQDGMEFFKNAKAVRLQGHLGKYLVADDDEETVRQSRNGASHRARWTVEFVDGKRDKIRLKSFHGLYLTASDESFLLGMTGKKVLQTESKTGVLIEWEPVKDGLHVKLMTNDGKFLRANGGSPPWRNSVTHDVPHRTATQSWVLWGVEIMDISISDMDVDSGSLSPASSFSSLVDDFSGSPDTGSPVALYSTKSDNLSDFGSSDTGSPAVRHSAKSENMSLLGSSNTDSPTSRYSGRSMNKSILSSSHAGSPRARCSGRSRSILDSSDTESPVTRYSSQSGNKVSGMEFFNKAKTVRLKSHHDKYLTADDDKESVIQDRSGTSKYARWTVEFVEGVDNVVRLKSCYGKYLTASEQDCLLGVTGKRVTQSVPRKLDSSIEWEPIRDGMQLKLKTRYGNYLRANGGLPPWRNSITHDIPSRHHDWILWGVDVVETRPKSPPKVTRSDSFEDDLGSSSFQIRLPSPTQKSTGSFGDSPMKSEGRLINYYIADDNGNVNDEIEGQSFQFKGHGLEELTKTLEEVTGIEDLIVCSRNLVNGKLYPLRLALPPNNATMNIVVVSSTSRVARDFMPAPTST